MAFLISRRLTKNLLISSRSPSLSLLSLSLSLPQQLHLLHPSSSSTPTLKLKPQILDPFFIRSALFSTFRSTKPTFSPPNDDNHKTPSSGQNPNSIHTSLLENELRHSLRKSMDNIRGLKNAFTVLGFVHIGVGAFVIGSLPLHASFISQAFLASAVPFLLAHNMNQCLKMRKSINMKTQQGLFVISKIAWWAAWRLFVVNFFLFGIQVGVLFCTPHDLLMIPRIRVSVIAMTLFPALCGIQSMRMPLEFMDLIDWQMDRRVDGMIRSLNWMERKGVVKVANSFLLRFKNASYLVAGLSCSWLLLMHLQSYGILTFIVFK